MDISLFTREAGAGEPLVLLHGNGESGAYFQKQMPALSARYHVFAPDTRGHGQSPRGTAPFTLSQFADDLCAFFDEHGIDKAHLLGFSDGGNIALLFTLRYPSRVKSLILNGANLCPAGVKRRYQIPIEWGYRLTKRPAARDPKAKAKHELLGLMVLEPQIDPAALASLSVPTLVIAGTHDMIADAHTRLIARSIPGAKLVLLSGDHFIAARQAAAFNETVLQFLETAASEK